MARKQDTATREEWKAALLELVKEGDYLRTVVEQVLQQILEVEMDETLGAEKSERTANRRVYRSGYYPRALITRVGKKLELRRVRIPQREGATAADAATVSDQWSTASWPGPMARRLPAAEKPFT